MLQEHSDGGISSQVNTDMDFLLFLFPAIDLGQSLLA